MYVGEMCVEASNELDGSDDSYYCPKMAAALGFDQQDEEDFAVFLSLYALSEDVVDDERPRKRRATLPYVLDRPQVGAFHLLVQELAEQDPKHLHKFLRMSGETFDELLHKVCPLIQKQDTNFKMAIPPEERLAVTLRFLAEGGSYYGMFFLFRIPVSTLGYLIPATCEAIYEALKGEHLKTPTTVAEWKVVQAKFQQKWNFPQCLGALDGKHVRIKCPRNGGSGYFNYMRYHSLVLFAIVDATYKFLYHEVGAEGRVGDATVWNSSDFKRCLEKGLWNTPPPLLTPRTNTAIPSLIVADSAFALSPALMKPFPDRDVTRPRRIFNYRLSRARRVVENAFGILASRFRIYQNTIVQEPPSAKKFVLASLALHNFLRDCNDQMYCGPGYCDNEQGVDHVPIPGQWREAGQAHLNGLQNVQGGAHHQHAAGVEVREALMDYFMHDGAVPWQNTRAYDC